MMTRPMKKRLALLSAVALMLVLVLSLGACDVSEKSERATELCRQMTDAIIAGDIDAAYALVQEYHPRESFEEGFSYLQEAFEGVTTYELKMNSFKSVMDNGVGYFCAGYIVKTNLEEDILVEVAMYDGDEGLFRYSVSYSRNLEASGGITSMGDANVFQWILLILSALGIALVVLMVLDCAKRQLNAKALWIIVIVLGHLKVYANTLEEELDFGWNIGALLPYSRLILYDNGAFDFLAVLPVGAVVYFFLRKWLTAKYQAPTQTPSQETPELSETPAETPAEALPEAPASEQKNDTELQDFDDKK